LKHEFEINPATKIAYVSLNVFDLERSLEFYRSLLGFKVVGRQSGEKVRLSVDRNGGHLLELWQVGSKQGDLEFNFKTSAPVAPKRAGLYHFAILLPNRIFLADILSHLGEQRDRLYFEGMADHLVSESIYLRDPDFIGVEIYRDRPSSEWKWDGSRVQMATERLDAPRLMQDATREGWKEMPAHTAIGHVHLHVSELEKSVYYSQILGMNLTCEYPGANFFAANKYHHHIATNVWLGKGIAPASPGRVGLNQIGLELPSRQDFERTVFHLNRQNADMEQTNEEGVRSILAHDRDGIPIRLYCR
jgi:catechol 2,3-dioxygenase